MTVYSSEQDQITSEASTSSRMTDERRSSLGEVSKRRSRSREKDKTQELSFLPDVLGPEGLFNNTKLHKSSKII